MKLEEAKDFLNHYICCCPYETSPTNCGDDKCVFGMAIRILCDNARPQGEWIPVNERLPEEEDYRPCYGFEDGCVMWQTDNGDIGFGWYYNSTKCWSDINDNSIKTGKVIAWQPLPKPYEEADNE